MAPNRLADAPSPYLQQHKDNPVDWWPWSEAAFEEARQRDVPVFLSIGYATCHWCHVMAHESFEDDEVARLLNEAFVCVKVDREERPDVDDAYMTVCQAQNGSGGWPLTVLLTPDKRPWFSGTYFPRDSHGGRVGMLELVPRLQEAWQKRREEVEGHAQHIVVELQEPERGAHRPDPKAPDEAAKALRKSFDAEHGGFGRPPWFPSPTTLRFLLRRPEDQDMALRILEAMAQGGIHDHVGGGFHRYSTDRQWFLPHFEKMLYDQAGLLAAYAEAHALTGDDRWKAVAAGIVACLERDLRHPEGAFFAAEDADTEGEEGRFTTWAWEELMEVLAGDEELARALGARPEGNHHDESTGAPVERNLLHAADPEALAGPLQERWMAARKRLLDRRQQRVRPLRDEKVLTDWNALAIGSLARAAQLCARPDWLRRAEQAAAFLQERLVVDGGLRHRWKDGTVDDDAFLDDHAFLIDALVELHQAGQDARWLEWALDLATRMVDRFARADGAFALAPLDGEPLPVRRTDAYDGALPNGNAVAMRALWRLGRLAGRGDLEEAAWRAHDAFGEEAARMPHGFCGLWWARGAADGHEVVITGPAGDPAAQELLEAARTGRDGDLLVRLAPDDAVLLEACPWLQDHDAATPRAYVCRQHTCEAPRTEAQAVHAALAT